MTRKSRAIPILAVLLVAVMALSVFAMPVAAGTMDEETREVSADKVSNGVTLTDQVNFSLSGASAGDNITIKLTTLTEGEAEITGAEVSNPDPTDSNADFTSTDNATVTVKNGDVFKTTDDTVVIEFNDEISGEEVVEFGFTYELSSDLANRADEFNGDAILEVTADSTGNNLDNSAQGDDGSTAVVNLDVLPGTPEKFTLAENSVEMDYEGATRTLTVGLEDAQGNTIKQGATSVSLHEVYDENVSFTTALLDSNGDPVNTTEANAGSKIPLNDSSASNPHQATFDIDPAGDHTAGDLTDLVVGDQLTVLVDHGDVTGVGIDAVVNPNALTVEALDTRDVTGDGAVNEIDAVEDEGTTRVNLILENSTNDPIPNDEIDAITATYSNLENAVLDGDEDGAKVTVTHNKIATEEGGTYGAKVFYETDNAYDNSPTVTIGGASDSTSINVVAGPPAEIDFAEDSVEEKIGTGPTATVQVKDAEGNLVDDRPDFGSTTLTVTLTDTETIDDRSTEVEIAEGAATATVTFGSDIDPAVGEFELTAEQTHKDDLESATLTDVLFYPEVAIIDDTATNVDANETDSVSIELRTDAADDTTTLDSSQVDHFDLRVNLTNTTALQGDKTLDEVDAEIEGVETTELTISLASPTEDIDYSSKTAGDYELGFNAVPTVEGDGTEATTSEVQVDPLGIDEANSDVELDKDFVGTVTEEESLEVTVELRDEFGNYLGYTDNHGDAFDELNVHLDIAGTQATADLLADGDNVGTSYETADGTISYTVANPADVLPDTAETGEADVEVRDDTNDDGVSESIDLVHEAFDFEAGYQRLSVPQPADVHASNVSHFTTWNTSTGNYDSDDVDVTNGVVGTSELHSGIYAHGAADDARVGYDFVTDDSVYVGQESLEAGWNFLGTNLDISNVDNVPQGLNEDLRSVDDIDDDPSSTQLVYDGGLKNILDASAEGDDTTALTDAIDVAGQGEFGTYWVYVEDPDELDSALRQLLAPLYEPGDRANAKDGAA